MRKKGLIIVLSAPSGAGKSTIYKRLLKQASNLTYSISYTTRLPRKGERNGRDYFFVSVPAFKRLIDKKEFVEWAVVHGNYYGTSRSFIARTVRSGKNVVLDIDVQGAKAMRKTFPDAVLVFIMAPSFAELRRRLVKRAKDTPQTIQTRLANARQEVRCMPQYDYVVINDDISAAVKNIQSIIRAEEHRVFRLAGGK